MQLVEDVEGLVVSPSVINEDLSRGLFRAGNDGNGISGIVDPLALTWMVTSDDNKSDRECHVTATQSEARRGTFTDPSLNMLIMSKLTTSNTFMA